MTRIKRLIFATILTLFIVLPGQVFSQGNLVIVGGGLEANNRKVFGEMISLAGGSAKATFAVIPTAGGAPVQSFAYFKSELVSYGVDPARIHLIPVALADDDSTRDVNESLWKDNGNDPALADLVRKCTGVWFTGGDQLRTMKALVKPDGRNTPVLDAVWEVYHNGGMIGGTSAGAAVMSGVMIAGGTSLAALVHGVIRNYTGDDFPEDTGVLVTRGIGFFPHGVVDQHFNARARIGRLAVVLAGNSQERGFGIDENTALIYSGKTKKFHVAGPGGVTVVNAAEAKITYPQNITRLEGLWVSYLEEGDNYDCTTWTVTPARGKKSTKGKEQYKTPYDTQTGILSTRSDSFRDLYTRYLTDNKADQLQSLTLLNQATGFIVALRKTEATEGWFSDEPRGAGGYTAVSMLMDIFPADISATPLMNKSNKP